MKKVLIIANLFHASPRIPGLAKYLPEFGWQPIFLTTPIGERSDEQFGPPNDFKEKNRVIETSGYVPAKDVVWSTKERLGLSSKRSYHYFRPVFRFFYRRYLEIVNYPDAEKDWKPLALEAGRQLLQTEDIDALISSSSPVTAHLVANELKKEHKIPWMADFRDLWSKNANYRYGRIRRFFDKRLELKTLRLANVLVTVSSPAAEKLRILHKGKKVYTITNGFDPDKMSNGKTSLTPKFTITYTGQIYPRQDPSKLLVALKDLISKGTIDPKDVDVRFYGPENRLLAEKIEECVLSSVVRQCGIVSRESSFEKQRESQLLLLLKWEDPQERGIYTGKIFEYLASKRPILATGGSNDVVKELLSETNAGMDAQTVEEIKNALRELYIEFKRQGKTSYHGDAEKISNYSYRETAKKFAAVLNGFIGKLHEAENQGGKL